MLCRRLNPARRHRSNPRLIPAHAGPGPGVAGRPVPGPPQPPVRGVGPRSGHAQRLAGRARGRRRHRSVLLAGLDLDVRSPRGGGDPDRATTSCHPVARSASWRRSPAPSASASTATTTSAWPARAVHADAPGRLPHGHGRPRCRRRLSIRRRGVADPWPPPWTTPTAAPASSAPRRGRRSRPPPRSSRRSRAEHWRRSGVTTVTVRTRMRLGCVLGGRATARGAPARMPTPTPPAPAPTPPGGAPARCRGTGRGRPRPGAASAARRRGPAPGARGTDHMGSSP